VQCICERSPAYRRRPNIFADKENSMRARSVLAIAASLVLTSAVLAQESGGAKAKTAQKPRAGRPIVMPAGDLKWTDLAGAPGVKVADLWGDHTKGAFGAFFKLPAGFAVPLHTHTHDMNVVLVSGTYVQAPEGKTEFRLGPGSYLMQPGGNYRHTTSCDKASECLFFAESKGAFDLKLVQAPQTPGKNQ
jgi:anti-sigma factor ChrR (cupin superfamily)